MSPKYSIRKGIREPLTYFRYTIFVWEWNRFCADSKSDISMSLTPPSWYTDSRSSSFFSSSIIVLIIIPTWLKLEFVIFRCTLGKNEWVQNRRMSHVSAHDQKSCSVMLSLLQHFLELNVSSKLPFAVDFLIIVLIASYQVFRDCLVSHLNVKCFFRPSKEIQNLFTPCFSISHLTR